MTDVPALQAEKADLQRKLAARDGKAGYETNCNDIRARLAEIEAEIAEAG